VILCLDAGNSRVKYGLFYGADWLTKGALGFCQLDTLITTLPEQPKHIIACNVAGEPSRLAIESLAAHYGLSVIWFKSSDQACGVINGYKTPTQLGADRWAALIGARSLYKAAAIVVMSGTATTIDVLDASGVFRGGLILPGLELMRSALAGNTADLPLATGNYVPIPNTTDDAIISGALHATIGAIERMRQEIGQPSMCLVSGGAAAEIAARLPGSHQVVDNLVLDGLVCFASSLSLSAS
jgi:type III pantothenate kinase